MINPCEPEPKHLPAAQFGIISSNFKSFLALVSSHSHSANHMLLNASETARSIALPSSLLVSIIASKQSRGVKGTLLRKGMMKQLDGSVLTLQPASCCKLYCLQDV